MNSSHCVSELTAKKSPSPKKKSVQSTTAFGKSKVSSPSKPPLEVKKGGEGSSPGKNDSDKNNQDNSFREFRKICIRLAEEPSYNAKSKIMADFFTKGSSGGTVRTYLSRELCITNCRVLVPQCLVSFL